MRLPHPSVGLALVAALAVAGAAKAQPDPASDLPTFERIEIPGLAHGSITALAQDAQGFLWIGTRDGLSRWDGYDVLSFRNVLGDPTSLSNSFVVTLYIDQTQQLWVGTDDGLNRYMPSTRSFVRYALTPREGADDDPGTVWAILQSADGTLWVGTSHGLYRLDPDTDSFEPMGRGPGGISPTTPTATAIRSDADGGLWVLATDYPEDVSAARLYRVGPQADGRYSWDEFEMEHLDLASYSFFVDSKNRFWTGGVIPKRPDVVSRRLVRIGAVDDAPETARAFTEDHTGRVWIGTIEGLFVNRPGSASAMPVPLRDNASWLGSYIGSLLEDAAGTLWVGTNAGLYRSDPATKAFNHVGERDPLTPGRGLSVAPAAAIARDAQGDVWIGTWGGGVDRIDARTGRVHRYVASADPSTALPEATAVFLLLDSRGRLWASANEHLCQYIAMSDDFHCHTIPEGDGTMRWIWGLAEGPAGRLFAGTNYSGVFEFLPERGEFRPFPADPKERATIGPNAFTLATQPDGVLWVGGMRGTLGKVDLASGTATRIVLRDREGRPGGAIHEIMTDARGRLWVGGATGLFVLPADGGDPAHYTQLDGLPGSYVYALLEDDRERVWMATNRGIARYDSGDPAAGPSRTYDLADGIGSMEFNRHARFRATDGTLYFGGAKGVTWFDPDAIVDNPHVPPIVMTAVRVTDRNGRERVVDATDGVRFGPADHSVSFEFSALSYTAPSKNRYRYRLEGFDEGWVEAGDRRFATYTNIPNGNYVFRVQGSNNDGVWNEQGLAVPIAAIPAAWETWWFRVLLALALAGLLAVAYRVRVNQLLQVERMRSRIAGDLHDDLSSDLSGIALTMDLLERKQALDATDRRRIAQVRETALDMVEGVRDIVWYVNPEHDSLAALARRMKRVSTTLLPDREVEMAVDLPDVPVAIDMGFRRNVFLVFKELLHNVAKHSGAGRVWIQLRGIGDRLALHVRDDGVGFDPTQPSAGDGLASLRRRARQLGGTLEIQSTAGAGTQASFEAPLHGTVRGQEL